MCKDKYDCTNYMLFSRCNHCIDFELEALNDDYASGLLSDDYYNRERDKILCRR